MPIRNQGPFSRIAMAALSGVGLNIQPLLDKDPLFFSSGSGSGSFSHLHAGPTCGGVHRPVFTLESVPHTEKGEDRRRGWCRTCAAGHPVLAALSGTGPLAGLTQAATHLLRARDSLPRALVLTVAARHLVASSIELAATSKELAGADLSLDEGPMHEVAMAGLERLTSELALTRSALAQRWRSRPRETGSDVLVWFADLTRLSEDFDGRTRAATSLAVRGLATWPTLALDEPARWAVCRAPGGLPEHPAFAEAISTGLFAVLPRPERELTTSDWDVFAELVNASGTDPQFAILTAQAVMA